MVEIIATSQLYPALSRLAHTPHLVTYQKHRGPFYSKLDHFSASSSQKTWIKFELEEIQMDGIIDFLFSFCDRVIKRQQKDCTSMLLLRAKDLKQPEGKNDPELAHSKFSIVVKCKYSMMH